MADRQTSHVKVAIPQDARTIKEYAANIIADNMLSQVDSKGYSVRFLDAIVDYRKTEHVVAKEDGNIVN